MTVGVLRRYPSRPGRTISIFYFTNSLGAAAGVLVAGFLLLGVYGLPGTLFAAAALNVFVAVGTLASLMAGNWYGERKEAPYVPPPSNGGAITRTPHLHGLMLGVALGTAVASFVYEIGWIRMLSLVFGSSTHSFEIMLSAFILGLALGSLWVRERSDRWKHPMRALGILQWLMGVAALATIPLYTASFDWMAILTRMFAKSDAGYAGYTLARYGIGLAIMVPATFCAGTTLPLITRILLSGGVGERAVGWVYGVNTMGSILGVASAGLVLMPSVGLKNMLVFGATLDMVLGVLILLFIPPARAGARRLAPITAAATLLVTGAGSFAARLDPLMLTSGVFRDGDTRFERGRETLFYRDGRTATVSVTGYLDTRLIVIASNGKPEASLPTYWLEPCPEGKGEHLLSSDAGTQLLLPAIALAFNSQAHTAAVIGQGSGMTSHFLLASPTLENVVTLDIEPQMIHGSMAFHPANRRVFEDPRSTIVIDDARSYFAASGRRFDLILSEPSNPWVSGVSSLFTEEFYRRIRNHLSEGGIFGQWVQLYEIDDVLVLDILAAIHRSFPSYEIYQSSSSDIVIIASNEARPLRPDWSVLQLPAALQDLCHHAPLTARMLDAAWLLNREALAPLLDDWPQPSTDSRPILDLGAERARYLGRFAEGFMDLSRARFHIAAPFQKRVSLPTEETIPPLPDIWRMRALAVSAELRHPGADDGLTDPMAEPTRYLVSRWETQLSREDPPADWKAWLEDMRIAEANVHGGFLGFADEEFYGRVLGYLDRVAAPPMVRDVVSFRHGLARWDFDEAASSGDRLYHSVLDHDGYLPVDEYLDGMVVAKLRQRDPAVAREIFDALISSSRREPGDLRRLLLEAYVTAPYVVVPGGAK